MHQKVTVIRIVDWSFKGEWASKALSLIISKGNKAESVLIDFFCTSEEIGGELEKCGFLSDDNLDSKIPYLFRPIFFADGIRLALDLPPHRKLKSFNFNEWYVPKGDSDIDRVKL